jgi:hypothetical protein
MQNTGGRTAPGFVMALFGLQTSARKLMSSFRLLVCFVVLLLSQLETRRFPRKPDTGSSLVSKRSSASTPMQVFEVEPPFDVTCSPVATQAIVPLPSKRSTVKATPISIATPTTSATHQVYAPMLIPLSDEELANITEADTNIVYTDQLPDMTQLPYPVFQQQLPTAPLPLVHKPVVAKPFWMKGERTTRPTGAAVPSWKVRY